MVLPGLNGRSQWLIQGSTVVVGVVGHGTEARSSRSPSRRYHCRSRLIVLWCVAVEALVVVRLKAEVERWVGEWCRLAIEVPMS